MKILFVDDSLFSRNTMKRHFAELSGIQVFEATNGIEALELHRSIQPDVIFLDVTMPYLDGTATLKIIRTIDDNVKIIMATALGGQQYLCNEFIALGVDGILTKPVTKDAALNVFYTATKYNEATK
ncbi:response regulator [bacterium BFN5]|nr:response regulator [bacterium BFN5]QJW45441.1 response regulator [bacterium BFN5]